jgi:hypothetical protein
VENGTDVFVEGTKEQAEGRDECEVREIVTTVRDGRVRVLVRNDTDSQLYIPAAEHIATAKRVQEEPDRERVEQPSPSDNPVYFISKLGAEPGRDREELFTLAEQKVFPTAEEVQKVMEEVSVGECVGELEGVTKDLMGHFADVFKVDSVPLQAMKNAEFRINLRPGITVPRSFRKVKLAPAELAAMEEHCAKFVSEGLYFYGKSFFTSGALVVFYPATATRAARFRVVIDLRRVNDMSTRDVHPIPDIWDILETVAEGEILGAFDGYKMFHQVAIHCAFTRKLCSVAAPRGTLVPTRMPQGHVNAASVAQRSVENAFQEFLAAFLKAYIDDLFLYTKAERCDPSELQQRFDSACAAIGAKSDVRVDSGNSTRVAHFLQVFLILNKCRANRVTLSAGKAKCFFPNLAVLGFEVANGKVTLPAEKVATFRAWPRPFEAADDKAAGAGEPSSEEASGADAERDQEDRFWLSDPDRVGENVEEHVGKPVDPKSLRSLLGAAGYCRPVVNGNFAATTEPLRALLKSQGTWNSEAEIAFRQLLVGLTLAPVIHRRSRPLPLILETDWSKRGKGACLSQLRLKGDPEGEANYSPYLDDDGVLKKEFASKARRDKIFDAEALRFVSEANTETDAKLCPREGEALAGVYAVKRLRCMLFGEPFLLLTDHSSLRWVKQSGNDRVFRWFLFLSQFTFRVCYQKGETNCLADGLSRYTPDGVPPEEDEDEEMPLFAVLAAAAPSTPGTAPVPDEDCFELAEDDFECLPAPPAADGAQLRLDEKQGNAVAASMLHAGCAEPGCFCKLARWRRLPAKKKTASGKEDGADGFNQVVHADDVGPSERTAQGNEYATVLVDGHTGWREAYCHSRKDGPSHRAAFDRWNEGNGPPAAVHADGAFFGNQLPPPTRKIPTPPYKHNANGKAERTIGVLCADARLLVLFSMLSRNNRVDSSLFPQDRWEAKRYWDFALKYAAVLRNNLGGALERRAEALGETVTGDMKLFEWGTLVGYIPAAEKTVKRERFTPGHVGIFLGWTHFAPRGNTYVLLTRDLKFAHTRDVFTLHS